MIDKLIPPDQFAGLVSKFRENFPEESKATETVMKLISVIRTAHVKFQKGKLSENDYNDVVCLAKIRQKHIAEAGASSSYEDRKIAPESLKRARDFVDDIFRSIPEAKNETYRGGSVTGSAEKAALTEKEMNAIVRAARGAASAASTPQELSDMMKENLAALTR